MAGKKGVKPHDFGLVAFRFKRSDGSGAEFECPAPPSCLIRAQVTAAKSKDLKDFPGLLRAYYAAQAAGLFEGMGFEPTGDDSADVLRFFDQWNIADKALADDGSDIDDPDETVEDPT